MTEISMETDSKQEAVLSRASMCEEELIVDWYGHNEIERLQN